MGNLRDQCTKTWKDPHTLELEDTNQMEKKCNNGGLAPSETNIKQPCAGNQRNMPMYFVDNTIKSFQDRLHEEELIIPTNLFEERRRITIRILFSKEMRKQVPHLKTDQFYSEQLYLHSNLADKEN